MYVTRPLSLYKRSPESLSLAPQEGPNSGYLVVFDEESETTSCFGLCKNKSIKHLPFPQNKDLTVWYAVSNGQSTSVYYDEVLFIPVLNQPLSSNQYYVIPRQGKHKGQACTNSKEEDKGTFCCCTYIKDVKPKPLDSSDIYQRFEINRKKYWGFWAKSVAPNGFPPNFLRRKYWSLKMRTPRNYHLDEAPGLNSSLRAHLQEPNLSSLSSSQPNIVIGKWYSPFVFVKEGNIEPKDQMEISTFYEITLEQRWDKIFGCKNVENEYSKVVSLDVFVEREEVFVYGRKAVWDKRKLENGVIWFKNSDSHHEGVEEVSVGLSLVILERMKWEQERVGWIGGDEKGVRVERREEFGGTGTGWREFGCYVLVERFVLKRMDGSIVLAYDFKHTHQIRCKWE